MNHLLWVVGLITLAFGGYETYVYMYDKNPGNSLMIAVICFVVSLICWALFFFRRFREEGEQDISITKL